MQKWFGLYPIGSISIFRKTRKAKIQFEEMHVYNGGSVTTVLSNKSYIY